MAKTKQRAEFGDFQTPDGLAQECCQLIARRGLKPRTVIEPTCGRGSFLFAALDTFSSLRTAIGIEINPAHVTHANSALERRRQAAAVEIRQGDFFNVDWPSLLADLPQPILIVGNPPWVTNAHLTVLGSSNVPIKSNFQSHNGLDAVTGKANFDISEWMLIKLLEAIETRDACLAMLCKAAVARKVLYHGWRNEKRLSEAEVRGIDAGFHFDAAVEASLLVVRSVAGAGSKCAKIYDSLVGLTPRVTIGYRDGSLVADLEKYDRRKHLQAQHPVKWRSGVKHDCSKVMELRKDGRFFINGLGEEVELEDTYVYPMLKSSDVANGGRLENVRWMIVPQRTVGEDTRAIESTAPLTWRYLKSHEALLGRRGSSIYRDRPPFSVFGVGDYSFSPWKVAISGFYKRLNFVNIGCIDGKPVMLDDTVYCLPCESAAEAEQLTRLLNSPTAREFYSAFIFWDAKRPITVDVLSRLDIAALARELGEKPDRWTVMPAREYCRPRKAARQEPELWAPPIKD